MVIKVYMSGNSGNKEIETHQQRIFMILKSLGIEFLSVDIAGPGMEEARDFMRAHGKKKEGQRNVLPPQIFNEEQYCGTYEDFDIANEDDVLEEFLKLPLKDPIGNHQNSGDSKESENRQKKEQEIHSNPIKQNSPSLTSDPEIESFSQTEFYENTEIPEESIPGDSLTHSECVDENSNLGKLHESSQLLSSEDCEKEIFKSSDKVVTLTTSEEPLSSHNSDSPGN